MYLIICFEYRTRFYLVPRVLELTFDKYFKTEYNITYAICFACTTNKYSMHVQVKVKRDLMIHSIKIYHFINHLSNGSFALKLSRINFKISHVNFFLAHVHIH